MVFCWIFFFSYIPPHCTYTAIVFLRLLLWISCWMRLMDTWTFVFTVLGGYTVSTVLRFCRFAYLPGYRRLLWFLGARSTNAVLTPAWEDAIDSACGFLDSGCRFWIGCLAGHLPYPRLPASAGAAALPWINTGHLPGAFPAWNIP